MTFSDICFLEGSDGWFRRGKKYGEFFSVSLQATHVPLQKLGHYVIDVSVAFTPPCAQTVQTAEQQSGLQSLSLLGQPFVREAFEFWGGLNHLQHVCLSFFRDGASTPLRLTRVCPNV